MVPVALESKGLQRAERAVDEVDWEKVALEVEAEAAGARRVKVIEVEVGDADATAALAGKLRERAAADESSTLCSVAVLPPCGPPLSTAITVSFDVCFNPLSLALTFVAAVCRDRGVDRVVLVADEQEASEAAAEDLLRLSTPRLADGLLYRHGISATVLKTQQVDFLAEDHVGGQTKTDRQTDSESRVVFVVSKNMDAGHSVARRLAEKGEAWLIGLFSPMDKSLTVLVSMLAGLVSQQNACFIVQESLRDQNIPNDKLQAESALLKLVSSAEIKKHRSKEKTEEYEADEGELVATYLSIADVSDQTLQGVRTLLRQGQQPDTIQAVLYEAYGTQRVVAPSRNDQFSDMNV
ncbi:unnamed protein product [Phytophthora fragariaefolia]|uniref:Unnamed protein product n=1 Tax=Phytophthora fragariaefolia TaxID=1490495 RepID=A0A9W6UAL2_9STRA|nr:unnamed protein product [Phytophthora fragariaefolia]